MNLSKETIAQAISDLKGTAQPLLKVWLTLKAMGLDENNPVLVDTKNSTSTLKRLFNSGDPNGRFYIPFSPTPSDAWMQSDASRSIIQTTVKKWFDGKITTVDPRSYLKIEKDGKKYKVSLGASYPNGLGNGPNGFARSSQQTLAVPMVQFAVWVLCREPIPEATADVKTYLCDKLRTLLHLTPAEEPLVFTNENKFEISMSEDPITDKVLYQLCGGVATSPVRDDSVHQLITYGAPGTGKSFNTKKETDGHDFNRTTFHPDSDYSTFVGAYKPTMESVPRTMMKGEKIEEITQGDAKLLTEKRISYDFVPQAFTKAYVKAWKKMSSPDENLIVEPVFLIIEEINRGNCAQIFGDLFQLLDRNDAGFSDYPIDADDDLARFLSKKDQLGDLSLANLIKCGTDDELAQEIINGKKLCLPPNLYIRATMNTSDQSLFPIDSAFKRRWDWEYMPIKDEGKGWCIKVGEVKYEWWSFLKKINEIVFKETDSADKKMGYFFVKLPKDQKEISVSKFVNKVAFYLWNDVFKDCEIRDDALKLKDNSGKPGDPIGFTDFFLPHSNVVNEDVVKNLLDGLGVEKVQAEEVKTEVTASN